MHYFLLRLCHLVYIGFLLQENIDIKINLLRADTQCFLHKGTHVLFVFCITGADQLCDRIVRVHSRPPLIR